MFLPMFILFTGVPALELYLLFKVGAEIGALNTIWVIIGTGVLGAALAKSQGLSLINSIQRELNAGNIPAKEIIQGFCVFGGGLLLLTPGFMTDIIGFCMILPGPRNGMAYLLKKWFEKAAKSDNVHFSFFTNVSGYNFQNKNSDVFDAEFKHTKDETESINVEYTKRDEEKF
jgi:UPF0716 protein FxsA